MAKLGVRACYICGEKQDNAVKDGIFKYSSASSSKQEI